MIQTSYNLTKSNEYISMFELNAECLDSTKCSIDAEIIPLTQLKLFKYQIDLTKMMTFMNQMI